MSLVPRPVRLPVSPLPSVAAPRRALLVGGTPLTRAGLRWILALDPAFLAVDDPAGGVDLVLIDLHAPDLDGARLAAEWRRRAPDARLVVVAPRDRRGPATRALQTGADAVVFDDADAARLLDTWRAPRAEPSPAPPAAWDEADGAPSPLTPREREVLRLVSLGQSNKAIAAALRVSENTVKNHVKSILTKMRVHNRTEAAVQGRGLIDAPVAC